MMGSERFEFESEAWYRAVAEGRLDAGSDGKRAGVTVGIPPDASTPVLPQPPITAPARLTLGP